MGHLKICSFLFFIIIYGCAPIETPVEHSRPNIIFILTDDQGYGDLGVYGSTKIKSPRIDQMAAEGIMFTSFYAHPLCSPSRAAFLTGCYPQRVGMPDVFPAGAPFGLSLNETTVAEVLKTAGYKTACIGKWHVGEYDEFSPTKQGFDYFYGIRGSSGNRQYETFSVPLYRNDSMLTSRPDHSQFTKNFTSEAINFIDQNKDEPFFLYLAHTAPHVPIYPSEEFRGKSGAGLLGDAVSELDWSTGKILDYLKENGLDENTLVIFTSDNGPWAGYEGQSGSAEPFRGKKFTTLEGGVRVPFIARWPGKIDGGTKSNVAITIMDLLPTFAGVAGAALPPDVHIDGKDFGEILKGKSVEVLHDEIYYYAGTWLQAIRMGDWKLHLPIKEGLKPIFGECNYNFINHSAATEREQLYDLKADPNEEHNLAGDRPEIVVLMSNKVLQARKKLGDYNFQGSETRPVGYAIERFKTPQDWVKTASQQNSSRAIIKELWGFEKFRYLQLETTGRKNYQEQLEWSFYVQKKDRILKQKN
ncbi:MAG: sulfatase [Flavobacteriales bacterium]|nr:sulfatase [Flavobacteriales bacterium]